MSYTDYLNKINSVDIIDRSEFMHYSDDIKFSLIESINSYANEDNNDKLQLILGNISNELSSEASSDMKFRYSKDTEKKYNDYKKYFENRLDTIVSKYEKRIDTVLSYENRNKRLILMPLTTGSVITVKNGRANTFNPNFKSAKTYANPSVKYNKEDMITAILGPRLKISSNSIMQNKNDIANTLSTMRPLASKLKKFIMTQVNYKLNPQSVDAVSDFIKKCDFYAKYFNDIISIYDGQIISVYYEILKSVVSCNKNPGRAVNESIDELGIEIYVNKEYDDCRLFEDFNNYNNRLRHEYIMLENYMIKLKAADITALNEASNKVSKHAELQIKNFSDIIKFLKELIRRIKLFCKEAWQRIKFKALFSVDRYAKWISANESKIIENINKLGKVDIPITVWSNKSLRTQISKLTKNAINKVIPEKKLTKSSEDTYKEAVESFNNRYSTNRDIYNTLIKTAVSDNEFVAKITRKTNLNDAFREIVASYNKGTKNSIDKSDVQNLIKVMKESKNIVAQLNSAIDAGDIDNIAEDINKTLNIIEQKPENHKYALQYFKSRLHVLDIGRTVINDLYNINLRVVMEQVNEAFKVLKKLSKSNAEVVNESATTVINCADIVNLLGSNAAIPDNIKLIDNTTNMSSIIPYTVDSGVQDKIFENKLYPICLVNNNIIILKSKSDFTTWSYDINNKILSQEF